MPVTHPTRGAAFILRKTEYGREEIFRFDSKKALAIDLVKRCNYHRSTGMTVSKVFSVDGTVLRMQAQSRIQTSHSKWGGVWRLRDECLICLEAFSVNGRPLNLRGLLELAGSLTPRGQRYARRGGVYCGYGPVPNVHKTRGGNSYFRNIHTTSEIRMNTLVAIEDGEVPARMARTSPTLPNSWNDVSYGRRSQGWKAQRSGFKAWMRRAAQNSSHDPR